MAGAPVVTIAPTGSAYRERGPHGDVCRVVIEYQANAQTNVAGVYSKRWNATCS
jgi:hypothetical protein